MAEREGGQWNVVATEAGVRLERVSDGGDSLFDDVLEPDEARQLGQLLTKHAAKVGESDDDRPKDSDRDSDDEDSDDSEDSAESDDESDDSGEDDDDSDETSDGNGPT